MDGATWLACTVRLIEWFGAAIQLLQGTLSELDFKMALCSGGWSGEQGCSMGWPLDLNFKV